MVRYRVLVSGRVQGVYFRDACRQLALQRGVRGWVRNLPDGRVEAARSRSSKETAMIRAELLAYCLAKPGAWLDEPWEGDVVVKVSSKIFAFLGGESASTVGVKCGPDRTVADEWVVRYPGDVSDRPAG